MLTKRPALRALLLAAAATAALTACSNVVPRPKVQTPPETGRVTFQPEQSVIELEGDARDLLKIAYDKGDPLPGDLIGPVEVQDMPLSDVLRLVTRANKLPVAVGSGAESETVSIAIPDRLPLAKIVDMVVGQAGAFYEYRDGVLHVEGQRKFSVRVPNVIGQTRYRDLTEQEHDFNDAEDDSSSSDEVTKDALGKNPDDLYSTLTAFADTVKSLGAENVTPNKRAGLITFSADKQTYAGIAKFFKDFEINRDLVIYDAWIYEVKLSDAKKAGIDWSDFSKTFGGDFKLTSTGGAVEAAAESAQDSSSAVDAIGTAAEALRGGAGGVTLGIMGTPGALAVDAMFQFLNTQGEAKTLAQPMISVIGGRESGVFVGESINYIREIGLNNDNNENNSNDNNNDNNDENSSGTDADLKVARLKTGIRLGVTGDVFNGVVETDVNMSFVELLSLNNIQIDDALIQIPHTAERSLYTTVRARPGDVIMLGGLIYDTGKRSEDSLMLGDIPMKAQAEGTRSELVVLLRPRLIKFRPSKEAIDAAFEEAPVAVGPKTLTDNEATETTVTTPKAPDGIGMKKSSTTEQVIIDGIKAAPESTDLDLADEARKAIEGALPAPKGAPNQPAAKPLPAPASDVKKQ